ncbi:MAG TPA: DUF2007 domain-containing protein [Thiolapillus brandeum]|uniref:DUF2007 domain-containing protein n=1 Tax=Thiolapillus brandeum TaxID=1076588 RepID=A0A831RVG6_9GAMM|nr:DUF2007 domain-containing protein [Thiolapillus brandeum]
MRNSHEHALTGSGHDTASGRLFRQSAGKTTGKALQPLGLTDEGAGQGQGPGKTDATGCERQGQAYSRTGRVIPVFDALNSIEAHSIKIYLIGNGIDARVGGDYLQGAMGELPALGIVRVFVDEKDEIRAKKLIREMRDSADDDDSWIPPALR